MKMGWIKMGVIVVLLLGLMRVQSVFAACNPAECGDPFNEDASCSAGQVCNAQCCVAPSGGTMCSGPNDCPGGCCNGGTCGSCGGDPGGGWVCTHTPNNCPAGTTRTSTVVSTACMDVRDACNLGTAEVRTGTCNCQPDEFGEIACDYLVTTYSCVSTGTCATRTGCSSSYPGYRYTYVPTNYPTCSFGPPWPSYPSNYDYDATCEPGSSAPPPTCTPSYPGTPTLNSPSDGATVTSTSVSLVWNPESSWGTGCPASWRYYLYVDTNTVPTTQVYSGTSSTTSYNFTGTVGTTYYWRVYAHNGSRGRYSAIRSFTIQSNTITGTVYLDTDNNCSTTTPWSLGGLTASIRSTAYSSAVAANGTYSITASGGTSYPYLDLSGLPAGYTCSTAAGCNSCLTLTSVSAPSSGNNFFLTTNREAWWQARGGSVYAGSTSGGNTVRSELPSASTTLITAGPGGAIGALVRASGTVDSGLGAISTPGYTAQSTYNGKRMNYDYFAAHVGVTNNTPNDWLANTLNKPAFNASKTFYYIDPTLTEATISTPWSVGVGESYVVFVNGDLRIASNITVAEGGFLAVLVNGSVYVSPAVSDIQGLYVMDDTLITESNGGVDVAANFEGSMVAWGGVNLGRDLSSSNVSSPAEMFSYRPDLITNMPDSMKIFALRWEEVVPGTFGN